MSKNHFFIERIIALTGFLFLLIAFISSFVVQEDPYSILQYISKTQTIVHFVHGSSALLCFVLIFIPNTMAFLFVLYIESVLNILTSYEQLGIVFFYFYIILGITKGYFTKHFKTYITISFSIHFLAIIFVFPHGWANVFISLGTSIFLLVFYLWIYKILKEQFSCFIPNTVTNKLVLANVIQGDVVSLSKYGLTGRQVSLVLDYIYKQTSYKELGEKYGLGLSTIKREFSIIFKIFGVSKIEDLKMLLLQYQITE